MKIQVKIQFCGGENFVTQDSADFCEESGEPCDIQMIQAFDLFLIDRKVSSPDTNLLRCQQ